VPVREAMDRKKTSELFKTVHMYLNSQQTISFIKYKFLIQKHIRVGDSL